MLRTMSIAAALVMGSSLFANAEQDESRSHKFAKNAFATIHTLPRSDRAIAISRGLFASTNDFLQFIRTNYQAPNVGMTTVEGLTVTYSFPGKNDSIAVKAGEDYIYIGFSSIQTIKFLEKEIGKNCLAVSMNVTRPFGDDASAGSKIKNMNVVMTPMEECTGYETVSNGVPQSQ